MSISKRLAMAASVLGVLTTKKLKVSDIAVSSNYAPKLLLVQCRRCKGTGTKDDSADNCPQCGGKGTEKLTHKALRRWAKNNPLPAKTEGTGGDQGKA